jgi:transmembrane sensor
MAIGGVAWRAGLPGVPGLPDPHTYSTGLGEQRRLYLPDGSSCELNTQSTVRIAFAPGRRDVYLLQGEALFNVHHDERVPFRVHVGATEIQDVGTQFSVHVAPELTTVSVIEGEVRISRAASSNGSEEPDKADTAPRVLVASSAYHPLARDALLRAGEEMKIVADGTLAQRGRADLARATAWIQGRLVFSEATLEQVVAEFNRYNERQIILVGDTHRGRRFSGVFDARDPDSFLQYLRSDDNDLTVETSGNTLVVRGQ